MWSFLKKVLGAVVAVILILVLIKPALVILHDIALYPTQADEIVSWNLNNLVSNLLSLAIRNSTILGIGLAAVFLYGAFKGKGGGGGGGHH